ncbi:bifunctional tRNA (5-methylaminomethyl-2-thiouridine)(34)-methyltransferase MnmD/FAD-dependent 5-carboxymethylaminomethyl-2-thiouridine(34) oxidoreductase MnmC [Campylobacter sp. Marseille-Q3452]|uniref:Bifunctional tRNA (5-methylaminomethyl-2-thiouridine)(34)-methyltransferase MnmD/FAD-dependent 5-carboxymethylaminomethyl-2-thiouridine(34) oxidoreductase MnmC n=1 Tax=Campylobacter massiliensis TaxID=2762557 RepID=A0A842JA04_9BACT|nr:bifunctional tRNA (5-methylaminomethyl-2-thiouridine)(34)-methyltransferase MnmD/FAD-dependent 5-carboxymethylaminomethyl-2-thiouridine(34) oxidoreductase MnmC [Campylobacter massiliensis]MBC2882932.1 bifunctional tRNA (5-methylaminomethyl-2-thiouridine)(34)-methyltransferase MnmD/FAD-dependent 5-carboxymethylaminomethyl-2-thiouridine(34) oxidoreductase MnmC [Campylobacter massiliensis]
MKSARVIFKDGIPFSPEFDDIYFNADGPIGQSEYVFNSVFDEIWEKKSEFNVLETGFGAGLNFLCAFKRFKNSDKFLNFVSIEKTPIARDDLAKIYVNFSELADVSGELLDAYPPLIHGFHRLNLAPNVTLTLCFGDVEEVLDELSFIADAVFMDGFAPAKNEAMWSERVCAKIANLCAPGAAVCTYSASGALKRALQDSGFEVNLLKGYGKKREMLRAKFAGERQARSEIWFSRFDPASRAVPKSALVIGGGVAGCVCAFKLRQRGLDVTIAEKRGDIALNGSGNHCGILMPLITKPTVNLGRMHMNAFLQAARFYGQNLGAQEIEFCGATDYAYEQKTLERFYEWREFDADNGVFELKFDYEPYASAFIFKGAKARPRKMCKAASAGIKTLLNCEFAGFETLEGGAVRAHFKDGQSIDTDVLVLAIGSESMELFADYDIRLSSVRGQVTHIEPAVWTPAPFSAKGYVCPPAQGVQVIGATYDRNLFLDEPRSSDDEKNLADVAEFLDGKFTKSERLNLSGEQDLNLTTGSDGEAENLNRLEASSNDINLSKNTYLRAKTTGDPAQAQDASNLTAPENGSNIAAKIPQNVRIIGSKVGYRSYSGDRFPLIGRLYDEDFYKDGYKSLLWTKGKSNPHPKYVPNVYASTAHGSRGLCTAVLGAELICDLIFDRPLCIEKSLFDELHLARFLVRKLKKGLK